MVAGKAGYVLSPKAQSDLQEIWVYSAEKWGQERTERYVRDLWRAIERLSADPRLGRPCEEVREGYSQYRAGSHFIFYRIIGGNVDVIRILHQRMDFEQHL